ncbi:MAG: EpsG family protein [Clostridia bacterium]|nr:EpsG family protein [Clostridia bacterium]
MIIYLMTLALTFLFAYVAQGKQIVLEDGVTKKTSTNGKWAIAAVCAILIFIGGFRKSVGADYGIYEGFFKKYMNWSLGDVLQEEEGGFWAIATVVGWFTDDYNAVFFVCQVIIILCFVPTMAKYSHNLSLTVFLYLATFDFFSALNGVRQWTAAAILFAALPWLKEKKIIRYCLLCWFAYFFHKSAILMIPVGIFALTSPLSKWNVLALTGVGFLFFLMPSTFDSLLGGIVDEKFTQFIGVEGDDGVSIFRILVSGAPMVLARVFYKQLPQSDGDKHFLNILINLSTVNFVFYLVGMRSTVMARMSMYVSPFNCLLIPYLLRIFKNNNRFLVKTAIMAMFGLYLLLLLPVDSMVLPYQNIFGWYFA